MGQRRFRTKIILQFVPLISGVVILGSLLVYQLERMNLEHRTLDLVEENVAARSMELGEWFSGLKSQAELLAQFPEVASQDPARFEALLARIHELRKDLVTSIFVSDSKGLITDEAGRQARIDDRKYFTTIMAGGGTLISEPHVGRLASKPVFVVASALRGSDGKVNGLVGFSVGLDTLSRKVDEISPERLGYGWVMDRNGLIIAHPNSAYNLNLNVMQSRAKGFARSDGKTDPAAIPESGSLPYLDRSGPVEVRKLVTWMTIPASPSWRLAITILESEIYKGSDELLRTLILMWILVTTVLFALVAWLSSRINRPLRLLMEGVQDFETRHQAVDIKLDSKDEFEALARSVNLMTRTMVRYTSSMENAIALKTQEIRNANSSLSEKNQQLQMLNQELERRNVELKELSSKDELTGLYNRNEFNRRYPDYLKTARRKRRSLCVMMADLDNFKQYNDRYGHGCGDQILKAVGSILTDETRDIDFVARYGGDEFVILVEEELIAAQSIAVRILKAFQERQGFPEIIAQFGDSPRLAPGEWLACSIGIVAYTAAHYDRPFMELLGLADQALYQAKRDGKGRIRVHGGIS